MQTTKECLIANMKRCVELLESDLKLDWMNYDKRQSELFNKLLEVRRDSINLEKKVKERPWEKN